MRPTVAERQASGLGPRASGFRTRATTATAISASAVAAACVATARYSAGIATSQNGDGTSTYGGECHAATVAIAPSATPRPTTANPVARASGSGARRTATMATTTCSAIDATAAIVPCSSERASDGTYDGDGSPARMT